ncbi:hypothetical protein JXA63_04655 [Candidatus Woesebacteria bacterium]|nr:hypothetical protein [Candidatus Woesebacteria bacterium]
MGNKKKDKIKWQSVKIKYPKKLYLYAVWTKNESLMPYFMSVLHKSYISMIKDAEEKIDYYAKNLEDIEYVSSAILVITLSYVKDHPLKKSFWKADPEVKFDLFKRLLQFIYAIDKPDLYNVCVTPFFYGEKDKAPELKFGAAFAYLRSHEREIDTIMKASNFPVTPKAKNCSIYNIDEVYGYDLETGERVSKDKNNIDEFIN